MTKLKLRNPKDFIRRLKANKQPFKIVSTVLTKTIITDTNEYFYSAKTGLKNAELNLIKTVKEYVVKNNITAKCNRKHIQYINKGLLKNGTYTKDLYEIDLKSAYWNFALKNGFISKEIYERGNNTKMISKKARLIALGNLAKRKTYIEFDGENFIKAEFESSTETENVFFKVSQQTDLIMNKCKLIAGSNYLFYWCDAIFVNSKAAKDQIEQFLNINKVMFKTIPINKILKTRAYIRVWDDEHKEPRPFIFEPLKIKDLSSIID